MPAAKTISALYRSGTASARADTSLPDSGITSVSSFFGRAIRMHGDAAISRSPTAT
jgi:hypothetical protein